MEELVGKQIGSYLVTEFIGEGGMGTVWAGRHVTIDRKVAIKLLHPQYARNERIRQRFRNEASTLARLQHPNIVTLYDYVETPQQLCLVMEYVDGVNLDDLIRKQTGPLSNERLAPIFRQMLDAIGYAHQQKVIHRDIKPSNFMLTPSGQVKVLDFGIAKLLEDDQQLTKTGMRMGSTFYMSPEQINSGTVDHRADIYALGVTLFVLATGKVPYEGETSEFQVYTKIINEPLPKASSVYVGVTQGVERMIEIATHKRPQDRFQTCEEFLAKGRQAVAGTPNPPPQTSPVRQTAPPVPQQQGNPSVQAPMQAPDRSYVGVKIFGIVSAVLMLLATLIYFGIGGHMINAANSYGNYIELFGRAIFATHSDREEIALAGTIILVLGFIFATAGVGGIGIALRGRWGQVMSIVAHVLITLIVLVSLVILIAVANSGDVSYDARGGISLLIGLYFFFLLYCIWALIMLFGPWAGKYFMRKNF